MKAVLVLLIVEKPSFEALAGDLTQTLTGGSMTRRKNSVSTRSKITEEDKSVSPFSLFHPSNLPSFPPSLSSTLPFFSSQ